MAFAIRKIPLTVALMLGCSAIAVPAHAGWFDSDSKPVAKPVEKAAAAEPATNLEDSIRQAQLLRLAGQYPEAIKHLSQLMMVASDDGRVISEYGKTLAAMGRPTDAVNFLTRAQQLQPSDWTIYSALGVAYDQIGDQKSAQQAYEHALAVKPEEPSVLNNYALSRMLAKDPDMAHKLAARAESAGGNSDAKIARNITLIRSLAADVPAPVAAQTPPAQISVARNQTQTPAAASNTAPHPPASNTAPHPPVSASASGASNATPQLAHNAVSSAPEAQDNRVVMQRVPVDPLAGPVQPAKTVTTASVATSGATSVATNAPRPLQPAPQSKTMAAQPPKVDTMAQQGPAKPVIANIVKADVDPAAKPVTSNTNPVLAAKTPMPAPVTVAAIKPVPTKSAEASKPAVTTSSATPVVKAADASKAIPVAAAKVPAPVNLADTKPAPAKTAEAVKSTTAATAPFVKAAEAGKPVAVTPTSAAVKVADIKPAPAKAAEAAKPVASMSSAAPVVKAADASKPVPVVVSKIPTAGPSVTVAATKPAPAKTAEAAKPAASTTSPVVKAADAGKPIPVAAAKLPAPAPVKTAETKPAPAKTAEADKPAVAVTLKLTPPPVKAADAGKPVPVPKVLPPVPVKAGAKDAIPGLRMSANAY